MYKKSKNDMVIIENANIHFLNFSGAVGKYNPTGRRKFTIFLEDDEAAFFEDAGWNVRYLKPREEGDKPQAVLDAFVSYTNPSFQPKIVLVNNHGKTILNEDNLEILDWADVSNWDLMLRPYEWEVSGKKGIKAMVASLYATVIPDELEEKYYDTPDTSASAVGGCGRCEECDGHCQH